MQAQLAAQQAASTSVAALRETDAIKQEAASVLSNIQTGMQELHVRQGQAQHAATESDQRSATALRMVEELQRAREQDQRAYQARMDSMERMLQQQVSVANTAIGAIHELKKELTEAREESRRLQEQLSLSQVRLPMLTA